MLKYWWWTLRLWPHWGFHHLSAVCDYPCPVCRAHLTPPLKTLRGTVRPERLSGRVILCDEHELPERLDLELIVEDFALHKTHRVSFRQVNATDERMNSYCVTKQHSFFSVCRLQQLYSICCLYISPFSATLLCCYSRRSLTLFDLCSLILLHHGVPIPIIISICTRYKVPDWNSLVAFGSFPTWERLSYILDATVNWRCA